MLEDSKISPAKGGTQLKRFSKKLGKHLSEPKRRFLFQMLYGIQASQDVKLSNLSRQLNEQIPLIKTENRSCGSRFGLSRNLMELGLDGELNERISELGASFIGEDTVLALDISDIQKPYAKKMEYLEKVLDGSEGEIGNGYWFVGVTGADIRREGVIPLHSHLYSSIAPDFESENKEMLKAVDMVCGKVGSRGIWVIDRGGDRRTLFKELIKSSNFSGYQRIWGKADDAFN